jgi:neurotransmitter:Na+ symporter, NSS family
MRASFGSNAGFLLSAAGSAIGLGNIWKFPYVAGINGGGVFVLFYLICVMSIAFPLLLAEISIGQHGRSNAIKSFDNIEGKFSKYKIAGILGMIASILILSFYSVVGGWIIYYLYISIAWFSYFSADHSVAQIFNNAVSNANISLLCQLVFFLIVFGIVAKGVNKGIEKINKISVPFLILLLICMLYTVSSMPGFNKALSFLFSFNFEAFSFKGALEAIGHSFFTVSVGVGIMVTYGSYLSKSAKVGQISFVIVIMDTLIALISGLVIFSVLFSFDLSPGQGPVLMFKTLPTLFVKMNHGMFFAVAFFVLVLLTALTSAISLLEVPVAYLVDKGIKRTSSLFMVGLIVICLGIPCCLSFNLLSDFTFYKLTVFDLFDSVTSKILLPTSGLICALFFGFKMDHQQILGNDTSEMMKKLVSFTTRVFAPASILIILIGDALR